jgi:hypothetical protein
LQFCRDTAHTGGQLPIGLLSCVLDTSGILTHQRRVNACTFTHFRDIEEREIIEE